MRREEIILGGFREGGNPTIPAFAFTSSFLQLFSSAPPASPWIPTWAVDGAQLQSHVWPGPQKTSFHSDRSFSKESNDFAISRVQCPGGWLQRGDLCLYEVFFTFTLLISVLVIILVILLLLFLIFYTNELFMRRFCKRRVRKANMPTMTSSDKSSSTQSTNCCARPTSSTSSTRSLTTTTTYHPRLHSPDLTYRSLYKCDWPSHYSGLLSMYNSPPSSQITTCTTDLSLLYSLVDKRGSSKEPSPGALDEDTSTSVGDEWQEQKVKKRMDALNTVAKVDKVDKVEKIEKVDKVDKLDWVDTLNTLDKVAKVDKVDKVEKVDKVDMMDLADWRNIEERQLSLEEILALETDFLPQRPISSEFSLPDVNEDYPYFCREGRATIRRPLLIGSPDDPAMTQMVSSDQDRSISSPALATPAQGLDGSGGEAKIVIYVSLQLAKIWQLQQEGRACLR